MNSQIGKTASLTVISSLKVRFMDCLSVVEDAMLASKRLGMPAVMVPFE